MTRIMPLATAFILGMLAYWFFAYVVEVPLWAAICIDVSVATLTSMWLTYVLETRRYR